MSDDRFVWQDGDVSVLPAMSFEDLQQMSNEELLRLVDRERGDYPEAMTEDSAEHDSDE